jgi:hypothetical protein
MQCDREQPTLVQAAQNIESLKRDFTTTERTRVTMKVPVKKATTRTANANSKS